MLRNTKYAVACGILAILAADADSAVAQGKKAKKESSPRIAITYSGASGRTEVTDKVVRLVQYEYGYDHPAAAAPDRVVTVTRETDVGGLGNVGPGEVEKLANEIKSSGFFELNDVYGPPEGRSYTYTIHVRLGGREKKVTYHSTPDDVESPEAFQKVEKLIGDFARKATTIRNSPEGPRP